MTLKVQYAAEADAAFITLADGASAETITASPNVNLDFNANGELIAIEVLNASKTAPALTAPGSGALAAAE